MGDSKRKKRHVSLSEKVISYYLSQYFPDLKENYKNYRSGLGRKEIDMFIPSLNLAIEYDGQYYHQDISRDIEKNKILRSMCLDIVRIREPNCPVLTDDCHYIITSTPVSDKLYLKESILDLFSFINDRYGLDISVDVDIKRDRSSIISKYDSIFTSEYYGKSHRTRDEERAKRRLEKETRIIDLHNAGLTQDAIAKEMGISVDTVNRKLKKILYQS